MLTVCNHDTSCPPVPVRRQSTRPGIVDRRPITPPESPPHSPLSPPRNVHFPLSTSPVSSVSRPPNQIENFSLWYFEDHVYQCHQCHISRDKYSPAVRLCPQGRALSADVRVNVYSRHGDIYSKYGESTPNGLRLVRVEIPSQWWRVRTVLRAYERQAHDSKASSTVAVHNGRAGRERRDSLMGDIERKPSSRERYSRREDETDRKPSSRERYPRREDETDRKPSSRERYARREDETDRKPSSKERRPRREGDTDKPRHHSRSHSRSRSRSEDEKREHHRYDNDYTRSRDGRDERQQPRYTHHYYPRPEESPSRSERGRRVIVVEVRGSKEDSDRRTRRTVSRD